MRDEGQDPVDVAVHDGEAERASEVVLVQSQFQLHSPPFSGVQGAAHERLRRRSEPRRTRPDRCMNSWKACWGQPLTSSHLVSSAPRLTRRNEEPDRDHGPALRHAWVAVWVAFISGISVVLPILALSGILASVSRREIAGAGDVDAGTVSRLSG
jgi:hypothetical protein